MRTQAELRAFTIGCMIGIVIFVLALLGTSYTAGIKWQPVQSDYR